MKQKILLLLVIINITASATAQNSTVLNGELGFAFSYDAAGNRLRRVIVENNAPTPPDALLKVKGDSSKQVQPEITAAKNPEIDIANVVFEPIDALYPNPTTGIFYMEFLYEVKNATITITDINGKIVQQKQVSGFKVSCDLSNLANGTYLITIVDKGYKSTKKLIKQ